MFEDTKLMISTGVNDSQSQLISKPSVSEWLIIYITPLANEGSVTQGARSTRQTGLHVHLQHAPMQH